MNWAGITWNTVAPAHIPTLRGSLHRPRPTRSADARFVSGRSRFAYSKGSRSIYGVGLAVNNPSLRSCRESRPVQIRLTVEGVAADCIHKAALILEQAFNAPPAAIPTASENREFPRS